MLPGLAGVGKSSRSVVGAKYGRPVRGSFGCGAVRPAGFEDVRRCTRRDGAGKRGNQRPLSSTWRSGWSARPRFDHCFHCHKTSSFCLCDATQTARGSSGTKELSFRGIGRWWRTYRGDLKLHRHGETEWSRPGELRARCALAHRRASH